ncbi:MAG: hypothetical protein ACFFBE_16360 [Promethearchaeota archaeon]
MSYYGNKLCNPCYLLCTGPILIFIGISLGPGGSIPLIGGILMVIGGFGIVGFKVNQKKKISAAKLTTATQKPKVTSTDQKPQIIPTIEKPKVTSTDLKPQIRSTEEKLNSTELKTKITGEEQKPENVIPECPGCGNTVIVSNDYFCRECGYKLK